MKPPKTLIEAKNTPIDPQILLPSNHAGELNSNILPTMMIPLIALVTLIKGVWRDAVTFQMTMYPMKMAKMKTKNLLRRTLWSTGMKPSTTNTATRPIVVTADCLIADLL